jgi:hypothetical protein
MAKNVAFAFYANLLYMYKDWDSTPLRVVKNSFFFGIKHRFFGKMVDRILVKLKLNLNKRMFAFNLKIFF